MRLTSKDIVPLSQMRINFTDLADEARQGHEKVITKNGESYIALVDPDRLDYYHRLEQEHIHLHLLQEVENGLHDIECKQVTSVNALLSSKGKKNLLNNYDELAIFDICKPKRYHPVIT